MSIEKVREYLKKYDADNRILEFDSSSATVELAAVAVGQRLITANTRLSFIQRQRCSALMRLRRKQAIESAEFPLLR